MGEKHVISVGLAASAFATTKALRGEIEAINRGVEISSSNIVELAEYLKERELGIGFQNAETIDLGNTFISLSREKSSNSYPPPLSKFKWLASSNHCAQSPHLQTKYAI